MSLGDLLHLAQHHRGDFRQRKFFLTDLDAHTMIGGFDDLVGVDGLGLLHFFGEVVPADQALRRSHGLRRRVDHLGLGGVPHLDAAILVEMHDRSGGSLAERIVEHLHFTILHDRNAGVARSQIDSNGDFRHVGYSSSVASGSLAGGSGFFARFLGRGLLRPLCPSGS